MLNLRRYYFRLGKYLDVRALRKKANAGAIANAITTMKIATIEIMRGIAIISKATWASSNKYLSVVKDKETGDLTLPGRTTTVGVQDHLDLLDSGS